MSHRIAMKGEVRIPSRARRYDRVVNAVPGGRLVPGSAGKSCGECAYAKPAIQGMVACIPGGGALRKVWEQCNREIKPGVQVRLLGWPASDINDFAGAVVTVRSVSLRADGDPIRRMVHFEKDGRAWQWPMKLVERADNAADAAAKPEPEPEVQEGTEFKVGQRVILLNEEGKPSFEEGTGRYSLGTVTAVGLKTCAVNWDFGAFGEPLTRHLRPIPDSDLDGPGPELKAGTKVVLGRHRAVDGYTNWEKPMDRFVGTIATLKFAFNGGGNKDGYLWDVGGESIYCWRARDMYVIQDGDLPGDSADAPDEKRSWKVGDRVRAVGNFDGEVCDLRAGMLGTVANTKGARIGVEWDEDIDGHNGNAAFLGSHGFTGKQGRCWFVGRTAVERADSPASMSGAAEEEAKGGGDKLEVGDYVHSAFDGNVEVGRVTGIADPDWIIDVLWPCGAGTASRKALIKLDPTPRVGDVWKFVFGEGIEMTITERVVIEGRPGWKTRPGSWGTDENFADPQHYILIRRPRG